MIDKFVRADLALYSYAKHKYKVVYTVHDEDTSGEFGFVALRHDDNVEFKITEEKYIDFLEMTIIHEFMEKLYRIENADALKELQDEYLR